MPKKLNNLQDKHGLYSSAAGKLHTNKLQCTVVFSGRKINLRTYLPILEKDTSAFETSHGVILVSRLPRGQRRTGVGTFRQSGKQVHCMPQKLGGSEISSAFLAAWRVQKVGGLSCSSTKHADTFPSSMWGRCGCTLFVTCG